ncbi:LysR family transcriptional regulator [Shewanella sp. MMG014]|uniref:LysR family transcriptional regulator n=1 Tax=Shewanella sp. MMG014 TaxID=2822691 RepID=UPI001B36360F|nr:LysR family transcriptional regulator [Shewanella sp. MMG014]MBQ4888503.1 LysR family transcriptional regulator [Shewanella sp. MMG014]
MKQENLASDALMQQQLRKLDLNLIRVFCCVCDYQSITLAAEHLALTQSSVSNAINRFKAVVGVELFIRQGRGIALTAIGQHLHRQLSSPLIEIEQCINSVKAFDPSLSKRVFHVSANESIIDLIEADIEKSLTNKGVEIIFTEAILDEGNLYQALKNQQIDLALDIVAPTEASFTSKQIATEKLVCVARAEHPQFKHGIDEVSYFAAKHLFYRLHRHNQRVAEMISTDHLPERYMYGEKSSLLTMLSGVSKSDAICIAPYTYAKNYQSIFNLILMDLPFESQVISIYSIWPTRNHQDPAIKWLRELVESAMEKVYLTKN